MTLHALPPERTDESLMLAACSGDKASFDELFERWRLPLYRFLQRRAGSATAADDAFQETWLRVYRWRDRFDPKRSFRSWLFRIAANAGYDAREPVVADFHWMEPRAPDQRASLDLMVSALHLLDGRDRRILLLTIEGFTSEEVAEILDLRAGAVRARLMRARQHIREALHARP